MNPKRTNPFSRAAIGHTDTPANYQMIVVKAMLLFIFALFFANIEAVQEFYIGILDAIYSKGFFGIIISLVLYGIIFSVIVGILAKMVLSGNKIVRPIAAILFAALEGLFLSYLVAIGSQFTLGGINIAEAAMYLTLAVVLSCLILANFMSFDRQKASKMLVVVVSIMITISIIWILGIFIPSLQNLVINVMYLSIFGIAFSLLIIGFLSYVLIGVLGYLKTAIKNNQIDKSAEWFCSSVVLYLIVKIYQEILKLLLKIAARRR